MKKIIFFLLLCGLSFSALAHDPHSLPIFTDFTVLDEAEQQDNMKPRNIAQNEDVIIYFTDIKKFIHIYKATPEEIKNSLHITGQSSIKTVTKSGERDIYLTGKAQIHYLKYVIDVHAGTLFINHQGIEFSDGIFIAGDYFSSYEQRIQ
jgi:hypothetical protein